MYIFSATTTRQSERLQTQFWVEGGVNDGMVENICSRAVAHIPGANMKEFLVTILGEAKRLQIQLSEPGGRVLGLQWSER